MIKMVRGKVTNNENDYLKKDYDAFSTEYRDHF